MMQVDVNEVIGKLNEKIATLLLDNTVLELKVEKLELALAEANRKDDDE